MESDLDFFLFLKIISNYIQHIVKSRIHFLSGERISRLETKNATNDLNLVFLFPLYSFLEIVRSRRKKKQLEKPLEL